MARNVFVILVICCFYQLNRVNSNALDDYVNKPDPAYGYKLLPKWTRQVPGEDGYTAFVLNMTSQTWLTAQDSTTYTWWHHLYILTPNVNRYPTTALLYIWLGGNNPGGDPSDPLKDEQLIILGKIVSMTGQTAALIKQVPNQPCRFYDDPRNLSRSEDDIIAYTWRHYIENGTDQPEWLLRFPMTKAAVRAMDTVTDFADKRIKNFFVAGESKRGWTTWTTGAVDKRVIGIMPIVLDCLNFQVNLHHSYRALGGWTFAFEPYWSEKIPRYIDDPNIKRMEELVDPYAYRDRLIMPKYIVTTGGDEFFYPDDSHYYYDNMKGPTYLRIHPNAEHSLTLHRLGISVELSAFMLSVLNREQFPVITWERWENNTHGFIKLKSDLKPLSIEVYEASTLSATMRDFRLAKGKGNNSTEFVIQPILYRKTQPEVVAPGEYLATVKKPPVGWKCFFYVMKYPAPNNLTVAFTSEVNIIPDTFPFPQCIGDECQGSLV